MRTIFSTMVITNVLCVLVMLLLWKLNYKKLHGIWYWVLDFGLQTLAVLLIVLRGKIPDWISIYFANFISIFGIYLGFRALEVYFRLKSKHWMHYALLLLFPILFIWSTQNYPDIAVRYFIIGLFSFWFCLQCFLLVFFRLKPIERQSAFIVGLVFFLLCLVDLIRMVHFFTNEQQITDYFHSNSFEGFVILSYKILLILLTFGLALMYNQTLLHEIAVRDEKFFKAFHSSPYALVITRLRDNCILEANETFSRMTNCEHSDGSGDIAMLNKFWDNPDNRVFILKELEENHKVQDLELIFHKKNGERFTALYSAQIILVEQERCLMSSINDISKRKQAEEELKESEAKFRSLFTQMSEGFALHEIVYNEQNQPVDYRILEVNQAYERMVGVSAEKSKGRLATVVYEATEAPYLDVYSAVAASGMPQSFRTYYSKLERYYDIRVFSPIQGYFATVFSDITEQHKAEETLINNEINLRNLNATKDKFFSIIAHDLRSPFNSILGFSQLLSESVQSMDYELVKQYATIIEKSTLRTMDLLTNLLEWSRAQTGRMEFMPEYLEIGSVLNNVLELLEQSAQQKSITIIKEPFPTSTVYADRTLTSTVLRNLLSNAIKFTHIGGEIRLSAKQHGGMLEICVHDNGIGMKKENLRKLFRIEESYSTKGTLNEQGTGLGLLLCKEFVEKQGGKMRVESEFEKGSVFCFTLPVNF